MSRVDHSDDDEGPIITATRCDRVQTSRVEFLWEGRIPRGKVSVLDGLPGVAKSTFTTDLAARVTTDGVMPDGTQGCTGAAVLVSFEDDPGDTICPRFLAAGGDGEKLWLARDVPTDDGPRPLEIPTDLPALEALIVREKAVLVVIDPLMAALAADVRSNTDHHIRRALSPLAAMAERTGAAILLVRHLTKDTKVTDAVLRGGGSIGIIGAARAALMVVKDPDDPDRRLLAVSKMNLTRDDAPSLMYRVDSDDLHGVGRIQWLGPDDRTASDLLYASTKTHESPDDHEGKLGHAIGVLAEFLESGEHLGTEAKSYCLEAGVSGRTLDRAKEKLGVVCRPKATEDGRKRWYWKLPQSQSAHEDSGGAHA